MVDTDFFKGILRRLKNRGFVTGILVLSVFFPFGSLSAAAAMECPQRAFTEHELAQKLSQLRRQYRQIPKAFDQQETRLQRDNCMYIYFEYRKPSTKGVMQVFTFDMYGELMRFYEQGK